MSDHPLSLGLGRGCLGSSLCVHVVRWEHGMPHLDYGPFSDEEQWEEVSRQIS